VEAEAKVTDLQLIAGGVEFRQTGQGEISLSRRVVSVGNFAVSGPETEASVRGTVNVDSGSLNLEVTANTDLRIIEGFIPRSNASGRIESEVAVRGTLQEPDMNGFVNLMNAQVQIADPSLLVSDMTARIQLAGSRFQIERAAGDLNGGDFSVTGGSGIFAGGLQNAAIHVSLRATQLEYPMGLQSEIAADLNLNGSSPNLTLSGDVDILNALYREEISLRDEVFQRLTPQRTFGAASSQAPGPAQKINLDLGVRTTVRSTSGPV
jgi:autotransporter translocation and assembly factor TamB